MVSTYERLAILTPNWRCHKTGTGQDRTLALEEWHKQTEEPKEGPGYKIIRLCSNMGPRRSNLLCGCLPLTIATDVNPFPFLKLKAQCHARSIVLLKQQILQQSCLQVKVDGSICTSPLHWMTSKTNRENTILLKYAHLRAPSREASWTLVPYSLVYR